MNVNITSYCSIKKNQVYLNGKIHLAIAGEVPFKQFTNQLYKTLNMDYPKFFKLDNLCKLALLTTEFLGINENITNPERTKIGVIVSNSVSSLDTDYNFNESIKERKNYFPSPAIFVYSLPNILIGEICIRHKITGENAFFISKEFNPKIFCNYVNTLFLSQRVHGCIIGWVDLYKDNYESFIILAQHKKYSNEKNIFEENTLLKLYKGE
jgi:hypothetical protein